MIKYITILLLLAFQFSVVQASTLCDDCYDRYLDCSQEADLMDDVASQILMQAICKKQRTLCLNNNGCECLAQEFNCQEACNFEFWDIAGCTERCMEEHAPQCPIDDVSPNICDGRYAKIKVSNANLIMNAFGGTNTDAFIGLYANNNDDNAKFKVIPVGDDVIFMAKQNWIWDPELTMHAYGGSKDGNYIRLHGDVNYAKQHANSKFRLIKYNGKYIIKVSDQDLTMHAYGGSHSGNYIRLHGGLSYAQQHANSQFTFECVD